MSGELRLSINALGAVGVTFSGFQAVNSFSSGDTASGALSSLDAVMGVAAFIPGPDVAAAAYGVTRIVGDVALGSTQGSGPTVLDRMATLQAAGCL